MLIGPPLHGLTALPYQPLKCIDDIVSALHTVMPGHGTQPSQIQREVRQAVCDEAFICLRFKSRLRGHN
jgi:hypothetical protein